MHISNYAKQISNWGVPVFKFSPSVTDKIGLLKFFLPITVAARSKESNVFVRVKAGIVGSIPTQDIDVFVRLFFVCVVPCIGSGLATG
jgi:hypothetical protein